jgi:pimeloyl-ACP methyl ester carboxylesterase
VATIIDQPYAILAHSAGALAAAQFMTDPVFAAVAKPVAFVWVDLDPLVPRWQVDYFHRGVASVTRTFATVDDAARGFRRIYPKIPENRLLSFVVEGLRRVDGGFRMKLDPASYERWEPGDVRPMLPRIVCPTLVLRGSESIVTSADGIRALAEGLPRREIREIEGGSHMLLLEHPDIVISVIREFLTRHSSGL